MIPCTTDETYFDDYEPHERFEIEDGDVEWARDIGGPTWRYGVFTHINTDMSEGHIGALMGTLTDESMQRLALAYRDFVSPARKK